MSEIRSLEQDDLDLLTYCAQKNNYLSFGGVCHNGCKFCCYAAERHNPFIPRMSKYFAVNRKTVPYFLTKEDFIKSLDYVNPNIPILLSGAFCDAEPFDHPLIYELLDIVEDRFPDTIKYIWLSGKTFDVDKTLAFKDKYKNLRLNLSLLTFNKEMRNKLVVEANEKYDELIRFLKGGSSLVDLCTFFYTGDLDILKSDIETLYSFDEAYKTKQIYLRCFEYTNFHTNQEYIDFCNKNFNTWDDAIDVANKTATSSSFVTRYIPVDWNNEKYIRSCGYLVKTFEDILSKIDYNKDTIFVTAPAMAEYAQYYHPERRWVIAKPLFYGGSVTVAELLTVNDVVKAINGIDYKKLVVPVVLDEDHKDVIGESFADYGITNVIYTTEIK